jgi:PncC family amidohydrolase
MNDSLMRRVGILLSERNMTVSVCESCTGGMLGAVITSVPGSSRYFVGGIIAYSDFLKSKVVGVRTGTLKRFGAVSPGVAKEMALAVKKKMLTDIGVGITGIAGPGGGTKKKPMGLVYIAVAMKNKVVVRRFTFKGSRQKIRRTACKHALELLKEILYDIKIKNRA